MPSMHPEPIATPKLREGDAMMPTPAESRPRRGASAIAGRWRPPRVPEAWGLSPAAPVACGCPRVNPPGWLLSDVWIGVRPDMVNPPAGADAALMADRAGDFP